MPTPTFQSWKYEPIWVQRKRERDALEAARQQAQPYLRTGAPADLEVARQHLGGVKAASKPYTPADAFSQDLAARTAKSLLDDMKAGKPINEPKPAKQPTTRSPFGPLYDAQREKVAAENRGNDVAGMLGHVADFGGDLLSGIKEAAPATLRLAGKVASGRPFAGDNQESARDVGQVGKSLLETADLPARDLARPAIKRTTGFDAQRYIDDPSNPAALRIALGAATDPLTWVGPGLVKKIPAIGPVLEPILGNPLKASLGSIVGSAAAGEVGSRVAGPKGELAGALLGGVAGGVAPGFTPIVKRAIAGAFTTADVPLPHGNRIIENQAAGNALIHAIQVDAGTATAPLTKAENDLIRRYLVIPDQGYQATFGEAIPATSEITGLPIRWTQHGEVPGVGQTGYAEYFGAGSHGFEQPAIFVNDAVMARPPSDARDLLIRARTLPHEEAHGLWETILNKEQRDRAAKMLFLGEPVDVAAVRDDLAARWKNPTDKAQEAFAEAWASRQAGQDTPYSRLLGPLLEEVEAGMPAGPASATRAQRRQLTEWAPKLEEAAAASEGGRYGLAADQEIGKPWWWIQNPAGENVGFVTIGTKEGTYEVGLADGTRRTFKDADEAHQFAIANARTQMPFEKGEVPGAPPRTVLPDSREQHAHPQLFPEETDGGAFDMVDEAGHVFGSIIPYPRGGDKFPYLVGIPGQKATMAESFEEAVKRIESWTRKEPVITYGRPSHMAERRLWFHGTRDTAYHLPDPEQAIARTTQGPGVYMAADPEVSSGYGTRLFANEFHGNVLDLTARATPDSALYEGGPSWREYAQRVADRLNKEDIGAAVNVPGRKSPRLRPITADDLLGLANADRSPFTKADSRTPGNGYAMRDRIAGNVEDLLAQHARTNSSWAADRSTAKRLAGRFAGVHREDFRVIQALINDEFANAGADALYHVSPRADGEVLIVLNGPSTRVRADLTGLDTGISSYQIKPGMTVADLQEVAAKYTRHATILAESDTYVGYGTKPRHPGDPVFEANLRSNGQWEVSDRNSNILATFPTKEQAKAYIDSGQFVRFYQQGDPSKPTFAGMQPHELADIMGVREQNPALYDRLKALDEKYRLGTITRTEAKERMDASQTLRKYYADLNGGRSPVWVLPAGTREAWAVNVEKRAAAMRAAGWTEDEIQSAIPELAAPNTSHTTAEYLGGQRFGRLMQLEKIASSPGVDSETRQQARAQMAVEFGIPEHYSPETGPAEAQIGDMQARYQQQGPTPPQSPLGLELATIPNEQIKERPDLFQGRDADPGKTYGEAKVRSILENYDPLRAEPGLLVRDTSSGDLVVVRGHHRNEVAKRLAAAGEGPPEQTWQIVDADLSNPKQVANLRKQAMLSNYGTRQTNVREDLRAVRLLLEEGEDPGAISAQMGISPAQVDDYVALAALPDDIIDRVVQAGNDYGNVAEVARVANTYKLTEAETRALVARYGPGGAGAKISRPQVRDALEMFAADFRGTRASQAQLGFDAEVMGDANVAVLDNIDRMVAAQRDIRNEQLRLQRTAENLRQFSADPDLAESSEQLQQAIREKVRQLNADLATQRESYNAAKRARFEAANAPATGPADSGPGGAGGQPSGDLAPPAGASLFDLGAIATKPPEPGPALPAVQGLGAPSGIAAMPAGTQTGAQATAAPIAALEHGTEFERNAGNTSRPPRAPFTPPAYRPGVEDLVLQEGTGEAPTPPVGRGRRVANVAGDILNLPRSTLTSFDLSGTMRQGGMLGMRHPQEWKDAIGAQVKAWKSADWAEANWNARHADPDTAVLTDAGLYEAPWGQHLADLTEHEEAFMSRWVGKIPGLRASERAYAEGLNQLRFSVAKKWLQELREANGGRVDWDVLKKRMEFINAATGRGNIKGLTGQSAGPLINAAFFSPRFFASRLQVVGTAIRSGDKALQAEARKTLATFFGANMVGLTLLGIAGEAGILPVSVNAWHPEKSDFGKIRWGDTTYDIWAGYQPLARYTYQLVTNKTATPGVEQGKLTTLGKFARGKLAPLPAAAVNILKGENAGGAGNYEASVGSIADTIYRASAPIFLQTVADRLIEGDYAGALKQAPDFIGVSTNTFTPRSQQLDEKAEEIARERPEDYPDGATFFDLQPKDKQRIKDEHPDLWKGYVANGSNKTVASEKLRTELEAKQQSIDDRLLSGAMSVADWEKETGKMADELRYRRKEIYGDKEMKPEDVKTPLDQYFYLLDQVDAGNLQQADVAAWKDALPSKDQNFIDSNLGLGGTPLARVFKQLKSEYYDIPKYVGFTADEGFAIDELLGYARQYAGGDPAKLLGALNTIANREPGKFTAKVKNAVRRMAVNPSLGPKEDGRRKAFRQRNPAAVLLNPNGGYLTPQDLKRLQVAVGRTTAA